MTLGAGELRGQERLDEFFGEEGADDASAQAENVHVVVFNALVSRESVMDQSCPDAGDLVGGNRGTHAAAANSDAAFDLPRGDGACQRYYEIRVIIRGVQFVSAEVRNLMSRLAQHRSQLLFELKSAVVCRKSDMHRRESAYDIEERHNFRLGPTEDALPLDYGLSDKAGRQGTRFFQPHLVRTCFHWIYTPPRRTYTLLIGVGLGTNPPPRPLRR